MKTSETLKQFLGTVRSAAAWEASPGHPQGVDQQVLEGGNLNEENKEGLRARLLCLQPGSLVIGSRALDCWEEVYLVEGDLSVEDEDECASGKTFWPQDRACRPPGAHPNRFRSEKGCLLLELQYYEDQDTYPTR